MHDVRESGDLEPEFRPGIAEVHVCKGLRGMLSSWNAAASGPLRGRRLGRLQNPRTAPRVLKGAACKGGTCWDVSSLRPRTRDARMRSSVLGCRLSGGAGQYALDGVVTVVDARHVNRHLDAKPETDEARQLGYQRRVSCDPHLEKGDGTPQVPEGRGWGRAGFRRTGAHAASARRPAHGETALATLYIGGDEGRHDPMLGRAPRSAAAATVRRGPGNGQRRGRTGGRRKARQARRAAARATPAGVASLPSR
eukprot:gene12307-biopygen3459